MDDEDYDREDDPCDHDDYDTDILTGRCMCWRCGESWYATGDEIDRELRFQSEYAEAMDRENRRQWWRDLYYTITAPLRPFRKLWARWRYPDDGIPF